MEGKNMYERLQNVITTNLERVGSGQFDALFFIHHDVETNQYYDTIQENKIFIYDHVTPQDLRMYIHDPGICTFPHVANRRILVEIVPAIE